MGEPESSQDAPKKEVDILESWCSWTGEIRDYLEKRTLSDSKEDAKKIVKRYSRFFMDGGNLYKRSFSQSILRCLEPEEAHLVLREFMKDASETTQEEGR